MCMPANTFAHEEGPTVRGDLPYVKVTVRVPEQVANQAREIAKISGWQLADYLRTLICFGAVFFFLS